MVEATGNPAAGIAHAIRSIDAGKHIIRVNVEADSLVGWWLAEKARGKGVVYSMAYGDQPALVAEMVDWARSAGFVVAAAGKGTKYLPFYHTVTPDDVWQHYGLTPEEAKAGGCIECLACELDCQTKGLGGVRFVLPMPELDAHLEASAREGRTPGFKRK